MMTPANWHAQCKVAASQRLVRTVTMWSPGLTPSMSRPATTDEMRRYHSAYVSRTAPSTIASASGSRATLATKLRPRSSIAQPFRGIERGRDDRHIAGAATQMSTEEITEFRLGRIRCPAQIPVEGHQNARSAEAALQG